MLGTFGALQPLLLRDAVRSGDNWSLPSNELEPLYACHDKDELDNIALESKRTIDIDERGWGTERCRMAQATAPILDSTILAVGRL
jgi:hypothetical protein